MSEIVAILGAGASRLAGAPLMADFLDVAADLMRRKAVESVEDLNLVFAGIDRLQQVHSKSQLDITNVESVFAAFEMARTLGGFADYSEEDTDDLVRALRALIVATIEKTMRFPVRERRSVVAPPPYSDFADLCEDLRGAKPARSIAVITFNYDVAVDYSLFRQGIPIDYGIEEAQPEMALPVLKLHGSLNWGRCALCKKVVPWLMSDFLSRYNWRDVSDAGHVGLTIGSMIGRHEHCDALIAHEPLLVPPTWNKTEHHRELGAVWGRAAKELREAKSIFVFGFSLPPSDAFFRYLYALGTAGGSPLRRFWVFDPDESGVVESRFRELLGPGAEQRFKYFGLPFMEAIPVVRQEFIG